MLKSSQEWAYLKGHKKDIEQENIRNFFHTDPERFRRFSLKYEGLLLDYSKNRITEDTMDMLTALAEICEIEGKRDKMFAGDEINESENRAVLHTALRRPENDEVLVDGENVIPSIHGNLERMKKTSQDIRDGNLKGHTGKHIETVIHIGIGGSSLGPEFVYEALCGSLEVKVPCRFVSNIDGVQIHETLQNLNPETTLFVIASKSFTTEETLENARAARQWIISHLEDENAVKNHFIAISSDQEKAMGFGLEKDMIFPLPDWVGGRYSLWSSIGISLCIAFGFDHFRAFLDGAHAMDRHFKETPLRHNMPVILALLGIWHRNFWGHQTHAVLPYSYALRKLPLHLQQLDMESNGKQCLLTMEKAPYETGPVIFGSSGTDCQHSYFQLLHQGTSVVPCDFIGVIETPSPYKEAHKKLLSNMLAQSRALMEGCPGINEEGIMSHNHFDGNRPSSTIILQKADAFHIGMLLALYEHKVFVQGAIWNINSFDQWGVELGKSMARAIQSGKKDIDSDSSTEGLIAHIGL